MLTAWPPAVPSLIATNAPLVASPTPAPYETLLYACVPPDDEPVGVTAVIELRLVVYES